MHRVYLVPLSNSTIIQVTRNSSHCAHLYSMSKMIYPVWVLQGYTGESRFHSIGGNYFVMKQISYISVSSIFLSENTRITLLDVLFTVITWKTQQSYQWVSRKPPPLLSGSFSFEMECVINQNLYTLKHQLDNLKFSLIFIKYSCFKRQSQCKNVNVIKQTSLAWILLIATVYNCIHFFEWIGGRLERIYLPFVLKNSLKKLIIFGTVQLYFSLRVFKYAAWSLEIMLHRVQLLG